MHELAYSGLTDEQREATGALANSATIRLANGENLAEIPLSELTAYCIISELNLAVALAELIKRQGATVQ